MDMMKMMKQAADLQRNMKKKQKYLAKTKVQHTSGNVSVEATCNMKITSIKIDPASFQAYNVKTLENEVKAAVQGVLDAAQNTMSKEMGSITSGVDLPAGMKLPF